MISSPGIGSGLDINSLVTQLVAAEGQPASIRLARDEAMQQASQQALLTQEAQTQSALTDHGTAAGGALEHMEGNASLDSIRALAAEDPKRVANVVRTWVENG